MSGIDRPGLDYLPVLTEPDVQRIHTAALEVLSRTGLVVLDDEVLILLDRAGCPVNYEERHTRIPAPVVQDALATAPSLVTLYNRLREPAMSLGAGPLHARTSSGATGILDLESGRRREPTRTDAAAVARLADALPHVHGVSTMAVQPADVPATLVDVHAMRLALVNTIKPLGYVCLNPHLIEPVLSMLSVVAGGEEALRQRPTVTASR